MATTGIGLPIGLSFILQSLSGVDSVQAFAAGAALCSTSLGTTFTVIQTSGLSESRLGVVLTSAAMMDDVVGLVMVQIIPSLASSSGGFGPPTIIRPVLVSIAYVIFTPIACKYILRPFKKWFLRTEMSKENTAINSYITSNSASFFYETIFLLAMVSSATCAGTSGLFAAYLAGAVASWYDTLFNTNPHTSGATRDTSVTSSPDKQSRNQERATDILLHIGATVQTGHSSEYYIPRRTSMYVYEEYYQKPVTAILKPFFFASIGFSIPITRMFEGSIVWRGLVYTILMAFGKLFCGIWLVRIPNLAPSFVKVASNLRPSLLLTYCFTKSARASTGIPASASSTEMTVMPGGLIDSSANSPHTVEKQAPATQTGDSTEPEQPPDTKKSPVSHKPVSLYPCAILGSAMVARGEIGFLISAVAQSSGVFTSELFLVVTWPIFLCTFLGPISVGLLVRRVNKLQSQRSNTTGKGDPLGIWGMKGD